jgi:NUMOD4 motif/HNH endonuclease
MTVPALPDETWMPVISWKGFYEVSDLGRVRSLDREVLRQGSWYRGPQIMRTKGKILAPSFDTFGYPMVKLKLKAEGRVELHRIHSLVMEAFVGPRPEGLVVAHNDGVPANPHLKNLRYDTPAGNVADKKQHGTHTCGEVHSRAKLTQAEVEEIRSIVGVPQSKIAARFGITQPHVSALRTGRRWAA